MSGFSPDTLRQVGWGLLGVLLLAGAAALAFNLLQGNSTPKRHVVTTITTVKLPPPPPPPPPPKVEQPPEPQRMLETPKIREPEAIKPEPNKPQPAPPIPGPPATLGFEGDGGASGFGPLGGGGTGLGNGGGGGGGGNAERWYAGIVARDLQEVLQKNDKTRFGSYRVVVKVWIDARGAVTRSQLTSSSGDAGRDAAIGELVNGHVFSDAPTADVRQPIEIRLSGRSPA